MQQISDKILNLMRGEVASRSVIPSLTFGFFAIFIFFYGFHTTVIFPLIKIACIITFICSMLRIKYAKKMLKEEVVNKKSWILFKILTWINSTAWALIFALASWELKAEGPHFGILLAIMTGFLSASILTLSYDPSLFYPFQVIILAPLISLFIYKGVIEGNDYSYILVVCYTAYIAFQTLQYHEYRKQVLARFRYQIDLEDSLKELRSSQTTLIAQTAELMHSSRLGALGEMAAGIAHEINNPLMVIQGSSEQIERSLMTSDNDPDMILNRVNKAKTSIQKIKGIIEALQFFSQENKLNAHEVVELSEVLNRSLQVCQEMLKVHDIKLELENIPEVLIEGNSIQLSQVVFSLIKNADDALKHVDSSRDRWIKISGAMEAGKVKLSVSNGGPQIRSEIVAKLFQPFFTTKEIGKGIGLSLSISRGITMGHKGHLFLDASKKFTTFTLELPVKHYQ